jgi:hypothetical protein
MTRFDSWQKMFFPSPGPDTANFTTSGYLGFFQAGQDGRFVKLTTELTV